MVLFQGPAISLGVLWITLLNSQDWVSGPNI